MTDQATLRSALGDVRRAYRLLWCYQDRLFDIIRTITAEFDSLKFYMWRTNSASPIDGSTNPLTRSPWSAFPMMNVSYLYRCGDDPNQAEAGDWLLDIRVISDSGFDDDSHSPMKADPDDFAGIEATDTRINLYVFYCASEIKGNWLRNIWNELEWPEPDGKAVDASSLPVKMIGITLDVADLGDREDAQRAAAGFKKLAAHALGATLA